MKEQSLQLKPKVHADHVGPSGLENSCLHLSTQYHWFHRRLPCNQDRRTHRTLRTATRRLFHFLWKRRMWRRNHDRCNAGKLMTFTNSWQYIISNGGLDSEVSYPYSAEDGSCQFNQSNVAATLVSYSDIPTGDENSLQEAVAVGPVSVAIDASHKSFQVQKETSRKWLGKFYSSGVYYEPKCSSISLDHGVLVVGWGEDNSGTPYWIGTVSLYRVSDLFYSKEFMGRVLGNKWIHLDVQKSR